MKWLQEVALPPTDRRVLDSELGQLDGVEKELATLYG